MWLWAVRPDAPGGYGSELTIDGIVCASGDLLVGGGIGQVLTMPLFFASSAIYPLALMPGWLQVPSAVNALTYEVDALRYGMLVGAASGHGVGQDPFVRAGLTAVLVVVASRLYPRVLL